MPTVSTTVTSRTQAMKNLARELKFDAVGVADAAKTDPDRNLERWLGAGFHADMDWMERTQSVRQEVARKVPGARSVVVLARNYYSPRPERPPGSGRVATYAWGRDYHRALKKPLRTLADFLVSLEDDARAYASIDSGPVLERTWAERAGVASIGKNSLGLRRDLGSWFFLSTVITTVELTPDKPAGDLCGTCTLCLDACPTRAIVEPRVVDSRKCISYHTIENRGDIPENLRPAFGDWIFGCDICQEVCPWNRFATPTTERDFDPRAGHANPDLDQLNALDETEFVERFRGSPILRAKRAGMQRNADIARENK